MIGDINAFFQSPRYEELAKIEVRSEKRVSVSYVWNTEYKVTLLVKQILAIVIFPIVIYQLLHVACAKIGILPASSPSLLRMPKDFLKRERSGILLTGGWKYKRITIEVDGYQVDATIVGRTETIKNGRWMLASNGNGEFYEEKLLGLENGEFSEILTNLQSNAIVFNYPGVGASSGLPSRQAMQKAYRAMLSFLEDQKKGIGAKEIIGYGHSIGGGVQGDALMSHPLKKEIRYVFIKSRTFSDLASAVFMITNNRMLGILIKVLGWNISSIESSKQLQAPEIIIQTANVSLAEELHESSKIIYDGVIPKACSLVKVLLDDPSCPKFNKAFVGIKEMHNERLGDLRYLVRKVQTLINS